MLSLEAALRWAVALGLVLALPAIVTAAVRAAVFGTRAHRERCREQALRATWPDTAAGRRPCFAGFFHPHADAGGGGERVLWTMIKAIQDRHPFVVCVIYSADRLSRDDLVRSARRRFGLHIRPETVHVVELSWAWWVDHSFPRLTMLMQSIGSVVLAAQAIRRFCPDVFVESVGYAFTYPFVDLVAPTVPIVAYTHYPTISSDMQSVVSSREAGVNNDPAIAASPTLSALKAVYYRAFARMYAFAGSFASVVMTNSSWTHGHIVSLFGNPRTTGVVYPPCDTSALLRIPLDARAPLVLSLAQFRPEKNHRLQLDAFAAFLHDHPDCVLPAADKKPTADELLAAASERPCRLRYPALVMVGGARNAQDEARAAALRRAAADLGIERQVHVVTSAPWGRVTQWLERSRVGLHTMRDEHFGIGVVEMMAAGLLTIAHDSAGPRMDIVTPAVHCTGGRVDAPSVAHALSPDCPVGMVARSAGEFARMIAFALALDGPLEEAMRKAARHAADSRFSEAAFCAAFNRRFDSVVRYLDRQHAPAPRGPTSRVVVKQE